MRILKPDGSVSSNQGLQEPLKGKVLAVQSDRFSGLIKFTSKIGSTCDLGAQAVELTPGASSTCGSGACSCCSCCSW